ncbi:MAG TPA: hypothetical protein VMB52_05345 [Verrucomicrobiae bacterium]|nr:hypothetical protein [Verrucomicrobiae bacterium]
MEPRIVECTVVSPASAAELRDHVAAALSSGGRGIISIVLRQKRDVPAPEDEMVTLLVQGTTHLTDGGSVSGTQVEITGDSDTTEPTIHMLPNTISVHLGSEEVGAPLTASIVVGEG